MVYSETENIEREMRARQEQAVRQILAGGYLQKLRAERNLRLVDVSSAANISPNYLSEIEKGKKVPSEVTIRELADFFKIEEVELFEKFGKIPLTIAEELHENKKLQSTLIQIRKSKRITEDQKQEMYDHLYTMYKKFSEEIN